MGGKLKYLLTGIMVVIAVLVVAIKYWNYITNPWTRNGQVRAQVIQITPRVSGPLIRLPVGDNQFVKAGDLLFEIDPRTFEADLERARPILTTPAMRSRRWRNKSRPPKRILKPLWPPSRRRRPLSKAIPAGWLKAERSINASKHSTKKERHPNAP
jgi:hypothetical protein